MPCSAVFSVQFSANNKRRMKKFIPWSGLVIIVMASMFVSSCAPTPAPSNSNTYTSYAEKPRIVIHNNSYRNIVVGVEGPEKRFINVAARSSKTVYLKSGVYKYAVAAKNTRTISGYKSFAANRNYTWKLGVN
jgi:hypothetical protein